MAGPNPSPQNQLSPAATDLGFGQGDELKSETEEALLERRKQSLLVANAPSAAYGALGLGTGTKAGVGVSAAAQQLFGMSGLGG